MTEIQKLIVLPAALLAFVYSAQSAGEMTWRGQAPATEVVAAR
jgi:hypothetical protein